jgi:hypothetical protein
LRHVALIAAVAFGTAIVVTGASADRAAETTTLHQFTGFRGGSLATDLRVRARIAGSCWTTSLVEGRAFSWRCMYDNGIYDPCFSATAHSSVAVCPVKPWSTTVSVMRLTGSLPTWKHYSFNPGFPWGIWTTNHRHCVSYSGSATGDVAGRRVTYGCDGGGLLLGFANRQAKEWTIHYVPGRQSKKAVLVGITDAWT